MNLQLGGSGGSLQRALEPGVRLDAVPLAGVNVQGDTAPCASAFAVAVSDGDQQRDGVGSTQRARSMRCGRAALRPRVASVAFDELGQAVLGEEVVDGLAEQRLEGGVAVGREALELAVDRRGELAGHACLARACGCRDRAAAGRSARRAPGVPGADDDLHNPLRPHFGLQGPTAPFD